MKRMIAIALVILTMAFVLTGCGGTQTDTGMTNGTTGSTSHESSSGSTGSGSSGTNAGGSATDAGNGTPSSNENGIIEEAPPAARDDNVIEEFGHDMKDVVDDTGNAVQDAMEGRSSRGGTGMTGGR